MYLIALLTSTTGKMGPLLSEDCICKEKPGDADLPCQEDDTLNSKGSFKFVEEDLPNPPAVNSLWKCVSSPCELFSLSDGFEIGPSFSCALLW